MKALKPFILGVLLLGSASTSEAQFSEQFHGYDELYFTDMTVDAEGNIIVSGNALLFVDSAQGAEWAFGYGFGSTYQLSPTELIGSVNNSGLVRFDTAGSVSWSKVYTDFFIRDVSLNADQHIVGFGQNKTSSGVSLSRFDLNGSPILILGEKMNSAHSIRGYSICKRPQGGFYAVSTIQQNFDIISRITLLTEHLEEVWTRYIDPELDMRLYGVEADNMGNAIIIGSQIHDVSDVDGVVLSVDSSGAVTWANVFGSHDDDFIYDLDVFEDGEIILAGQTALNGEGDGTTECWCEDNEDPDRCPNGFYMLLEEDGSLKWTHTYGDFGCEYAVAIQVLGEDIFIGGHAFEYAQGLIGTFFKRTRSNYALCTGEDVNMPFEAIEVNLFDTNLVFDTLATTVSSGPLLSFGEYEESMDVCPILGTPETETVRHTLELFPNPADGAVTIKKPVGFSRGALTIVDAQGRIVADKRIDASPAIELSLHGMDGCLYFVSLVDDQGQRASSRLVVRD